MSERPPKAQKIDDSVPPPLGENTDVQEAAAAAVAVAAAATATATATATAPVEVSAATAAAAAPDAYSPGNNPTWDHRLNQLREFKAATGHTSVPNRYPANPQLATWVAEQRR